MTTTALRRREPQRAPAPAAAPRGRRRSLHDGAWAAGCVLLALALRVPFVHAPLGPDEGGVAFIARHWHAHGTSLYGSYWLDRPPLLVALYKLAVQDGAFGVRLLGAAAAVVVVLAAIGIGRELRGSSGGRVAGVLAGLLAGSAPLICVGTPAEFLAAGPAALSVLCLLRSRRAPELRWLAAAGALAVTAALVKQSFLDAGAAGAVFVVLRSWRRRSLLPLAAYAAGALVPVLAVVALATAMGMDLGGLAYALFGFRVGALSTLQHSNAPLATRMPALEKPFLASGLVLVCTVALGGLARAWRDRLLLATLATWLAAATFGVLAGGSYWPHYLIQLIVPSCAAATLVLGGAGPRSRVAAAAVGVVLAVATVTGSIAAAGRLVHVLPEQRIAAYIRAHAHPGDTDYMLYARANLLFYTDLPDPFPYNWSLILRAYPGARAQLGRLLASSRRPTWIVEWQWPKTWRLDPNHAIRRLLHHEYRRVTTIGGHNVLLRREAVRL